MMARWSAFLLWAMVAAASLFWGFKLFAKPVGLPAQATLATSAGLAPADLSRVLGIDAPAAVPQQAAPPPEASRFQLLGVVAPRSQGAAREGVALISVDQKPPRAYRVGAVIDGDTVLQSVHQRGVSIGPRGGAPLATYELPPPAPAATGNLPPAGGPAAISQFGSPAVPAQSAAPVSVMPVPPQGSPAANQLAPPAPSFPPAASPAPAQPAFGAGAPPAPMPRGNRPDAVR